MGPTGNLSNLSKLFCVGGTGVWFYKITLTLIYATSVVIIKFRETYKDYTSVRTLVK